MSQLPPLSLYVHIPWCVRKCPYCDFNSHAAPEQLPEAVYVDTLLDDLETELVLAEGRPLESIFIGGGTPSLFSASAIDRLLKGISGRSPLAKDIEITLEANPGTFEQARFEAYRAAGINRLSIGVQSFNAEHLQRLGRIHNPDEALHAIEAAVALFPRVNIDLMHGLPNQSVDQALDDLKQALAFDPGHLSWYQLTIEPNTEFHARPPQLPVDEALWAIQEQGQSLLDSAGYTQYEISAYSRPGQQARHNINYWQFGDYLGIGAGAHGKISHLDPNGQLQIHRRHKQRQPKGYLDPQRRLAGEEAIMPEDRAFEFMLNALRLTQGVSSDLFETRTGVSLSRIEALLQQARQRELMVNDTNKLAPTPLGRLFLNDLLALFLD
ncbi:radical SAM family heme chaperone HemW [Marinobacterium sediminicola]|uniref:Heme chaperone HemW n=1 Tax=Marinobacterium sediminicola TaxID=518898 RepID=A0ABY1RZS6_9GAMM|nr:radical SAM family heme chaperone HemW [Marinobacterium sediminicola]ULG69082.1 radical SAM family heme chaperone HemW [Marinobacterium sediminicola]SMR73640.1 oxygen-independent coproporphyrinogen-3 oxidase [Marinobacterium sediminicola]